MCKTNSSSHIKWSVLLLGPRQRFLVFLVLPVALDSLFFGGVVRGRGERGGRGGVFFLSATKHTLNALILYSGFIHMTNEQVHPHDQ